MTALLGEQLDASALIAGEQSFAELFSALQSAKYVTGYSHMFYRYPARFAPEFARAAIQTFTKPGDLILDPFAGGGTAIVEALAAGRRAIGLDLNPLAQLVTLVKTTPLSKADGDALRDWASAQYSELEPGEIDPRTRNLPTDVYRLISPHLQAAAGLRPSRRQRFARCALLRMGQWMLEARDSIPGSEEFQERLRGLVDDMVGGLSSLMDSAMEHGGSATSLRRARRIAMTSTARRYWIRGVRRAGVPSLVLTSPPYPGVHMLYHRWQVDGRRETPAPYWIANLNDGQGASYYTFGSRTPLGYSNYFSTLKKSFVAVRQVIDEHTTIAQIVAFSDPIAQLPLYLETMADAGFAPLAAPELLKPDDVWRNVPHRRWYVRVQDRADVGEAGKELLLLHRLKKPNPLSDGLGATVETPDHGNDYSR